MFFSLKEKKKLFLRLKKTLKMRCDISFSKRIKQYNLVYEIEKKIFFS